MEGLSKSALIKSLSPRVILSNHFLPKGTKMRVNLEDQGRQKVSFSFAQTKKPLQSPLFIPASNDTPVTEPQGALSQSSSEKAGKSTDGKAEQKQTILVPTSVAEITSPTSVSGSTRLKTNLAKMHFKKQILNVSASVEKPASVTSEELHTSELPKSSSKGEADFPVPQPQNADSLSENVLTELLETKESPISKKPAASQGKDGDSSSSTDRENVYKRVTRSQLDSAPHASETDGESAHVSSRRQSADSKSKTNSDSRDKVKKSSSSSHVGEREKSSSKRSENHERSSSYSRSDRDSRNTSSRSSRSEKDRRRSRSRSRSRSRGPRTSSSYSRSERYRSDRGSRSERSYYHESDRRSHRSSPRRERRLSRSRQDRTRESSHSDEDHRRTRTTDSTRSSHHLNSHKESKSSSSSKSDKSSKSVDSSQSSEFDKRSQSSKSERTSKRSDSDSQRKYSPVSDLSYRKSSSHYKSETNDNASHTQSKTHEKHHKSSSSDSEGKLHPTEKSNATSEKCKESEKERKRSESKDMAPSKSPVKSSEYDRQPNGTNALSSTTISETCPQSEKVRSDLQPESNTHSNENTNEIAESTDTVLQESLSRGDQEEQSELEIAITARESLNPEGVSLDDLYTVKDSFSSNDQSHPNNDAAGLDLCKSEESIVCKQEENVLDLYSKSSPHEPATQDVKQSTKLEINEPNEVLALENQAAKRETLESDPPCLTNESQQVQAQPNVDAAKKVSCSSRKSRWDIVGQDIFENDNSQRAGYEESNPVVQSSRFSNHVCQDSEIQQALATQFTLTNQGEISEQQVGSDTMIYKYKDQSEPSQASTTTSYHCDVKLTAPQTPTNSNEPLHILDKQPIISGLNTQSWNGESQENDPKESTEKTKMSKRAPARQDALGKQSEGSDSDNSEYDSDCEKAIKQLHSVVVVPKNSSLTKDAKHREMSPCHAENLSTLSTACLPACGNPYEVPNQIYSKQTQSSGQSGSSDSLISSVSCQSQSNTIDSTSHSEGASFMSTQPFMAGNDSSHGQASNSIQTSDIFKKFGQELKQRHITSQEQQMFSYYQREDRSTADSINDKHAFPLGWDYSQSEQPTSTCQQPDSSHGSLLTNTKLTGAASIGPEPRHAVASCTQQPPSMQAIKKPYLHEHYQETSNEIHPDSLTNDHDDYSEDKLSSSQAASLNTPGSSSFVQAHEISSNSRGSVAPDLSRDDTFRPHRGRGPPKKRRPEVESDSDNEAEVGPSSKRERLRDGEVSKETVVKTETHRPPLSLRDFQDAQKWKDFARSKKMPPYFDLIEENLYLTER